MAGDRLLARPASADFREFPRMPILSRESVRVPYIRRGRLHAHQVRCSLPWLYRLYRDFFLQLAEEACAEPVAAALDERYGGGAERPVRDGDAV